MGVVLAIVLGVGGYVLLAGRHAPARVQAITQPSPALTASTPSAPPGTWKFIASRSGDPQPLTLGELFPRQYAKAGQSATLSVSRAGRHCSTALLGASLETAALSARCTQVLRATYVSSDHKFMATIGVLNLVNVAGAERVGRATGPSEFIDPLPAAHGPARNIKKGTGIEEAEVKGHYLILIWAEFTSLRSPGTTALRQQLEEFAKGLINNTANVSLSSRMVTGKPR